MKKGTSGKASKIKKTVIITIKRIPLVIYTASVIFPLYFLISNSFKTRTGYMLNKLKLPIPFTIENFIGVFTKEHFSIWLFNSFFITIVAMGIGSIVACLLSYGFSNFHFKHKKASFSFVASLMIMPPIVTIVPLYRLYFELKLLNTYYGTILIYIAYVIPFWTYFLTKFFTAIPNSIKESAKIDGGSDIVILFRLILPLSKAPIITLTIASSLFIWNDLLIPLIFMQDDNLRTLMVGLTVFRGRLTMNFPALFAGMVISTIPMAILFIYGQKHFMKGILSGAIKG